MQEVNIGQTISDEIEQKIIALSGLGMSYKDISGHLQEMYGHEVSTGTLTAVTDKIIYTVLHGTYHHVSTRHLPRYFAEFCYRFNRRFELHKMVNRLAFVAARTPPTPQRLLKLAEVRW